MGSTPIGDANFIFPLKLLVRMRLFSRYGIIWGHIWGHKCPEKGTHSDGHVYNDETRGLYFRMRLPKVLADRW